MKIYRLNIHPGDDDPEGEDWDEYFPSLKKAKLRRQELINERENASDVGPYGPPDGVQKFRGDWSIESFELAALSPQKLALACLNKTGFAASEPVEEVGEYEAPEAVCCACGARYVFGAFHPGPEPRSGRWTCPSCRLF